MCFAAQLFGSVRQSPAWILGLSLLPCPPATHVECCRPGYSLCFCLQVGYCDSLLPPLRRAARQAAAAMDRKPISDLVA